VSLDDLMIKKPITVSPDDDIELAAMLIYNHKIGGMPVVDDGQLVGIVTATDMLRAFIDMMGILSTTSRIDVVLGDQPATFKRAMQIINDHGGDIISVSMTPQQKRKRVYYFRLSACKTDVIEKALAEEGFDVLVAMD
jgi:acetoin utilization protein AcuB